MRIFEKCCFLEDEMKLFIHAMNHPHEWNIDHSEIAKNETNTGIIKHKNGLYLKFSTEQNSLKQKCSFYFYPKHNEEFGLEYDFGTIKNTNYGRDDIAISDPKPYFMSRSMGYFLTLGRIDYPLNIESLRSAFDSQIGPTSWNRIRAIMLALVNELKIHGYQWYWEDYCSSEEVYRFYKNNKLVEKNIPKNRYIGKLFEKYDLIIFIGSMFLHPNKYHLPSLNQYTVHEKLKLVESWGDDFSNLPKWIQNALM